MKKEYIRPTQNESLQNIADGYVKSEETPKPLEVINEMDSIKLRLDNGEEVSPIAKLSYGFYMLNQSNAAREATANAEFARLNNEDK